MATNNQSSIGQLVAEIAEAAAKSSHRHSNLPADLQKDVEAVVRRDYERGLDAHFSRKEMRTILALLEMAVPGLNREQIKPRPLEDLATLASRLGADFKGNAFTGPEGLALLGFYTKERLNSRRPLICVNIAHHPAAVAAAFWHEVGHHLTGRIFDEHSESVDLSFDADYDEHLDKPMEIIADILVSLAAYPNSVARWLFASPPPTRSVANRATLTDEAFWRAEEHLRALTGFDFKNQLPASENLHYIAGMIHFLKLRRALLVRYGI